MSQPLERQPTKVETLYHPIPLNRSDEARIMELISESGKIKTSELEIRIRDISREYKHGTPVVHGISLETYHAISKEIPSWHGVQEPLPPILILDIIFPSLRERATVIRYRREFITKEDQVATFIQKVPIKNRKGQDIPSYPNPGLIPDEAKKLYGFKVNAVNEQELSDDDIKELIKFGELEKLSET